MIFLDADDYWLNPRLLEQLRVKLEAREEIERKDGGKSDSPTDKDCYLLKEVYLTLDSETEMAPLSSEI